MARAPERFLTHAALLLAPSVTFAPGFVHLPPLVGLPLAAVSVFRLLSTGKSTELADDASISALAFPKTLEGKSFMAIVFAISSSRNAFSPTSSVAIFLRKWIRDEFRNKPARNVCP